MVAAAWAGGFARLGVFLAVVVLAACGDDAGGGSVGASGTGAARSGEPCAQPNYTETGCTCEAGTVGHRTCSADYVWSECTCPPRETACRQGDMAACMCPGETTTRMTICLAGGTFDCPCPVPADGNDAG